MVDRHDKDTIREYLIPNEVTLLTHLSCFDAFVVIRPRDLADLMAVGAIPESCAVEINEG